MPITTSELRGALRAALRSPALSILVVLTLGLGIGVNAAVFSVLNAVLLQPLPYAHGDRLVELRQHDARDVDATLGVSAAELNDYRTAARSLDEVVEYHTMWFNLLGMGDPERVQTGVVSANYFDVLGIEPVRGRTFVESDAGLDAAPVVVLGYGYWQRRFGGDPGVIGRSVEMNDRSHTIIGVVPPVPHYPNDNDVWMPWSACPFRSADHARTHRAMRMLTVFARLAPGVQLESAADDVARVAGAMRAEDPSAYPEAGISAVAEPLREAMIGEARPRFLLLLGMAGLVLLLACANVANLLLARAARREHELAVRAALGAGRGRLVRQIVVESLALAVAGAALGLVLAWLTTDLLVAFAARFTPRAEEVSVDGWVLAFTMGAALLTGMLVSVAPALMVGTDPAERLRESGVRTTAGRSRLRARGALIGVQVALAFVLLVGAGLATRSLVRLLAVDPGFDPTNVLTARLDLDFAARTNAEQRLALYDPVLERIAALPGVVAVGLTNAVPLNGGLPAAPLQVLGRTETQEGNAPRVDIRLATPGYFDALRVPVLRGRAFTAEDRTGPPVALVNRVLARRLWGEDDPVGARVSVDGATWLTVVGVVGDTRQDGLAIPPADELYAPLDRSPPLGASLVVRTNGDPLAAVRRITTEVHSVDARQPVAFVQTLADVRHAAAASPRLTATLLLLFAGLALVIAAAGIAGVAANAVARRTREIGIRIALGSARSRVVLLLARQTMAPVLAGMIAGCAAALGGARLVTGFLFDTPPTDVLTFATVAFLLGCAALLATLLPALRAARVDPRVAFQADG